MNSDNRLNKDARHGFSFVIASIFTILISVWIWLISPDNPVLIVISAFLSFLIIFFVFILREYITILEKRVHELENKKKNEN